MYQNYSLTTWLAGLTEKQQRPRFTQNVKMEGHSSSPIKMKAAKTAGCCSLPWYLNMHERWWHLTASRHPPYKNSTHSELERERKKKKRMKFLPKLKSEVKQLEERNSQCTQAPCERETSFIAEALMRDFSQGEQLGMWPSEDFRWCIYNGVKALERSPY